MEVEIMRKIFTAFLLVVITISCSFAEDVYLRQIDLGRDNSGMTWYLLDYGVRNNQPYAIARKYYSSSYIKSETIEILTSRYDIPDEQAELLFFTEYRYEYTPDGNQYLEVYRKHYDIHGEEICRITNKSGVRSRNYLKVVKNTIQSKGAAYALGFLRK